MIQFSAADQHVIIHLCSFSSGISSGQLIIINQFRLITIMLHFRAADRHDSIQAAGHHSSI
jgi:hypothetical protein